MPTKSMLTMSAIKRQECQRVRHIFLQTTHDGCVSKDISVTADGMSGYHNKLGAIKPHVLHTTSQWV